MMSTSDMVTDINVNKNFGYEHSYTFSVGYANVLNTNSYHGFINPTNETPIQAMDLMADIDTEPLRDIIESMYSNNTQANNAFKFPVMAGLRTLIYGKLKSHKFLTQTYRDLLTVDGLAEILGYGNELPTYHSLHHYASRIGKDGIKQLFDEMVKINILGSKKHGITIGEDLVIDASPVESSKKDTDATVNGHYYETYGIYKSYLWHNLRCMNTRLPLAFHMTNSLDDEGKFFLPLIMKAINFGISPKTIYADNGYYTKRHVACAKIFWDADMITYIPTKWVKNKNATIKEMTRLYQKLWNKMIYNNIDYFVPNPSGNYMEMVLLMHDNHDLIGDFYRNDMMDRHEECPDGYMDDYHRRIIIEGMHGNEKRIGTVQKSEVRGLINNTVQLGLHLLMLHLIANVRLKHGIKTGLIDTAGIC